MIRQWSQMNGAHFIFKESKDGMNEKIIFALLFLYLLFETAVLERHIWQKGRCCLRGTVPHLCSFFLMPSQGRTELNFHLKLTRYGYL